MELIDYLLLLTAIIGTWSGSCFRVRGSGIFWNSGRNIAPLAASHGVRPARPIAEDSFLQDMIRNARLNSKIKNSSKLTSSGKTVNSAFPRYYVGYYALLRGKPPEKAWKGTVHGFPAAG